jgi:hypothetical protein
MKWDSIVWLYKTIHPYSFPVIKSSGGGILNIPIVFINQNEVDSAFVVSELEDDDVNVMTLTQALNDVHRVKSIENREVEESKDYMNEQFKEYIENEEVIDGPVKELLINDTDNRLKKHFTQFNPQPLIRRKALFLNNPLDRPGLDPFFDLSKLDPIFQATLAISQFSQLKVSEKQHEMELLGHRDHLVRLSATSEEEIKKVGSSQSKLVKIK